MSHRISSLCLILVLVALSQWPPVSEAQLQLRDLNMTRAVEILAQRFRQIADDGLGIAALEVSRSSVYKCVDTGRTAKMPAARCLTAREAAVNRRYQ